VLYALLKPLLFRLDAERAHNLISGLLRAAAGTPAQQLLRALYDYDDPILRIACAGLEFQNPLGLAAGFDKRAELIAPMAALGFSHIEIGTVTPRTQPGNDRPRMFRLPEDRALINRLGFNSPGMVAVARNLRSWELGAGRWGKRLQRPARDSQLLRFRATATIPGLLKPSRLINARSSGRRNMRGRSLPGCVRGVTVPISI